MGKDRSMYLKPKRSLEQQAYAELKSMLAIGESKYEAKRDGTSDKKIFSFDTFKTYKKHIGYFCEYIKQIS